MASVKRVCMTLRVCYLGNMTANPIHRTQTGVRLATPLLKVLKGLAEYRDMSLGDLLEGIVLHAFEGKAPFSPATLEAIAKLKSVYGCEMSAADSHRFPDGQIEP